MNDSPLWNLWQDIALLRKFNAYHLRRKFYLKDQPVETMIEHLRDEVQELAEEPRDILEVADCLNLIFNIAQANGFTEEQLVKAAREKLELRFTFGVVRQE